jgi:hypothetical protein
LLALRAQGLTNGAAVIEHDNSPAQQVAAAPESPPVTLILYILLVATAVIGLLWLGTLFFQGYFYTEPVEGAAWRAPVAGAILTLFFAAWAWLDVRNRGDDPQDVPFNTLFRFSSEVARTPEPVKKLWVVRKGTKEPVEYERYKDANSQTGLVRTLYREVNTRNPWRREGVEAILIQEDGKKDKVRFEPQKSDASGYRRFADGDGWEMTEYETGPDGRPTQFRFGLLVVNLLLNFVHLVLWFVLLWLLLDYRWPHALGLGFVLWLIMTLTFLPLLLSQAGVVAWGTSS